MKYCDNLEKGNYCFLNSDEAIDEPMPYDPDGICPYVKDDKFSDCLYISVAIEDE